MSESQRIYWLIQEIVKGKFGYDLGCGNWKIPNSIGIDVDPKHNPDLIYDCSNPETWKILRGTPPMFVDYLYSSHLIEDFVEEEQIRICKMWLEYIKPGGFLILYVPEKGAYKGVNLAHKREFEKGFMEKLFNDIGIKQFIVSYESNWSDKLYGILGIGKKGV